MKKPLHTQKVAILSRLIKDNHLTKDEALLLLSEEKHEVSELETNVASPVWHMTSTSNSSIIYTSSPYSDCSFSNKVTDLNS